MLLTQLAPLGTVFTPEMVVIHALKMAQDAWFLAESWLLRMLCIVSALKLRSGNIQICWPASHAVLTISMASAQTVCRILATKVEDGSQVGFLLFIYVITIILIVFSANDCRPLAISKMAYF